MNSWTTILWRYKSTFVLLLTPLLLLPVPLMIKEREAYCAYCILLMAVYWITEAIPLAITSFLPIVLFPLMGIMSASSVSKVYMKNSCWLFIGGLFIAIAVEVTGLHKRISLRVLLWFGTTPQSLMFGFMLPTFVLSMWISNTATTAMMLPIVQAVLEQLTSSFDIEKQETNRYLLEKTNDIDDEKKSKAEPSNDNRKRQKKYEFMRKGLTICVPYAASMGGIGSLTGTGPNLVLAGQFSELYPNADISISFGTWMAYNIVTSITLLIFGYFWLCFWFLGFDKRMLRCFGHGKKTETDVRVRAILKTEYQALGRLKWNEIITGIVFITTVILWFFREPGFMHGWGEYFGKDEYVSDGTVAITMAVSLFFLPDQPPYICGGEGDPVPRNAILNWQNIQHKFPWSVLFLLGGGFALAKGSQTSGFSMWLGDQLTALSGIPDWAICLVVTIITCLFTECTSNVATASIFIPILAQMASSIQVHPLYILMPATISTSLAFMLPVATPPNAIAFSYGHLQVKDLVKAGWMMNILGVLFINFFINTYGVAFFGFKTFPKWAVLQHNSTILIN